jgi:hypothetical protein
LTDPRICLLESSLASRQRLSLCPLIKLMEALASCTASLASSSSIFRSSRSDPPGAWVAGQGLVLPTTGRSCRWCPGPVAIVLPVSTRQGIPCGFGDNALEACL